MKLGISPCGLNDDDDDDDCRGSLSDDGRATGDVSSVGGVDVLSCSTRGCLFHSSLDPTKQSVTVSEEDADTVVEVFKSVVDVVVVVVVVGVKVVDFL